MVLQHQCLMKLPATLPLISVHFFASFELDTAELDNNNTDLPFLHNLVGFNNNAGSLSTASLKENILSKLAMPFLYSENIFSINGFSGMGDDGVFTTDELIFKHLGNIPATTENVESLVYGTLINTYKAIDQSELSQIKDFAEDPSTTAIPFILSHPSIYPDAAELFTNVFSDPAPTSIYSDQQIAEAIIHHVAGVSAPFIGLIEANQSPLYAGAGFDLTTMAVTYVLSDYGAV